MRKFLCLVLAAVMSSILFACTQPPPDTHGTSLYITWTVGGDAISLTYGLDEAGTYPHAVVNTVLHDTDMLAGSGRMTMVASPDRFAFLHFDSDTTGAGIAGTIEYTDKDSPPDDHDANLTVNCTALGANDGGIVQGTFTGTVTSGITYSVGTPITNGTFRVERHDAVGMPP